MPKRIFVYGSLRQGEYNYRPEQGNPIAVGHIKGADLYSLGAFPCIVYVGDASHTVVGEVYDLDDKLFEPIERMELGAGYQRRPVRVAVDDNDLNLMDADAYFYPHVPEWHNGRVESGDWSNR